MEQQTDFDNQVKLIPYHFLTGFTSTKSWLKNVWSLQKTTRTISFFLLAYKLTEDITQDLEDDDMIEWLELLMLPNLGLILTLLTIMIAAYVSWSHEVTGQDGMVLDNEESSEEVDMKNAG